MVGIWNFGFGDALIDCACLMRSERNVSSWVWVRGGVERCDVVKGLSCEGTSCTVGFVLLVKLLYGHKY